MLRAVSSAARSAGAPPTSWASLRRRTKNTTTLRTKPHGDALGAEQAVGERRREERLTDLQHGDRDEQRVDEPLRMGDQAQQRRRADLVSLASAIACAFDPRDAVQRRLGDRQEADEQNSMTMIATSIPSSALLTVIASCS